MTTPRCRYARRNYNKSRENFNLPSTEDILGYANFPLVEEQYRAAGASALQQYRNFGEEMAGQIRNDFTGMATELRDDIVGTIRDRLLGAAGDGRQMVGEYINTAQDQLCSDVEHQCNAFINPVFDATDRTCNGVYNQLSSICTELGQDAYDWGTERSWFPSSAKAPLRTLITSQCNNLLPSTNTMCGWVPTVRGTAIDTCQTQLQSGLHCD